MLKISLPLGKRKTLLGYHSIINPLESERYPTGNTNKMLLALSLDYFYLSLVSKQGRRCLSLCSFGQLGIRCSKLSLLGPFEAFETIFDPLRPFSNILDHFGPFVTI